jgi:hypothetical protein
MARRYKRKRIRLQPFSDTENYVDIPVISGLSYLGTNGQVFNYKIVNDSSNKSRTTKIKRVRAASFDGSDIAYKEDSYVDAERILVSNFLGTNGQIFKHKFQNNDPAPRTPEAAAGLQDDELGHYKVHYVRYYKNNDDSNDTNGNQFPWVTLELIDFLRIIGTNGQVFNYRMRWPGINALEQIGETPRGTTYGSKIDDADPYKPILGYCNPDLELMPEEFDQDSGDPLPLRMDMLQNLVNVKGPNPPNVTDHAWPFLWNGARNRSVVASDGNPFWIPCTWKDITDLYPAYLSHGLPPGDNTAFHSQLIIDWANDPGLYLTAGYDAVNHWVYPDVGTIHSGFCAYFVHLTTLISAAADNHGGVQSDVPGNSSQWALSFGDYAITADGSWQSWLGASVGGHNTATPTRTTIWAYGLYQETPTGGYHPPPLPPQAGQPPH